MEAAITEAAAQVPALVVLAFIVVTFLRFLKSQAELTRQFISDQNVQLRAVVMENSASCTAHREVLMKLAEAVRQCDPVNVMSGRGASTS